MNIVLEPKRLTASAFAPFGDVIQTQGAQHFEMNAGRLERFYDLADIDVGPQSGGRPVISIAECKQVTEFPCEIRFLERHPHGSQAIHPLFNQAMIVVVAPPGEQIQPDGVCAFVSDGGQGINLRAGTWHYPIMGTAVGQQFMIIDRGGADKNCDELSFDDNVSITLAPK